MICFLKVVLPVAGLGKNGKGRTANRRIKIPIEKARQANKKPNHLSKVPFACGINKNGIPSRRQ